MHIPLPHVNRFAVARFLDSFGLSLALVALAIAAMVCLVPLATGGGLVWTLIAVAVVVALFAS
ncbi:hypothetical protein, partial [Nocardia cerradoensis]